MAQYSSIIEVDASPAEAFAYLSDPANRAEWDPSVRQVAPLDGAHVSIGDRYEITVGFYGKAIDATYEIVELDEPNRIVFSSDGRVRGHEVIEITPCDNGSSIRLDFEVKLKGAARVLDRGLKLAYAGIGDNAAAGVKKQLG